MAVMTGQKGRGIWVFDLCLFQQCWAVFPCLKLGFSQMCICWRERRAGVGGGSPCPCIWSQEQCLPLSAYAIPCLPCGGWEAGGHARAPR